MKQLKSIIILIAVGTVAGLILVEGYNSVNDFGTRNETLESTPELQSTTPGLLPIQILSPQENTTYVAFRIPIDIKTNSAVAKITYNINGAPNATYTEDTKTVSITMGPHQLNVYAFDAKGKIIEYKTLTFTVDTPHITQEELQTTIDYFESQELTIEPASVFLIKGSVSFESKEEFTAFVKAQGITTIKRYDEAPLVRFFINIYGDQPPISESPSCVVCMYESYGNPPIPVIYSFAVKLIQP
ncbi:hypothetical protein [Candidatus Bathycorpusculum sp.]|uniref:hypothetical protein n=1 Tax=Candidatus Bathycorpusculum sp. TaxID=2994959 RepID=UPI00281942C7|nr:hypothetical protein [Candidatus Termitimicrobium sp.]MCL2432686.1 hypothetical protein [Candidatus Termitimicrobium sp.]